MPSYRTTLVRFAPALVVAAACVMAPSALAQSQAGQATNGAQLAAQRDAIAAGASQRDADVTAEKRAKDSDEKFSKAEDEVKARAAADKQAKAEAEAKARKEQKEAAKAAKKQAKEAAKVAEQQASAEPK